MAKKATPARTAKPKAKKAVRKPVRAAGAERRKASGSSGRRSSDRTAGDALFKLLESPLVADLLAIGATAALAAIAENRSKRTGAESSKSSRSLKAAGKAAAAAMGRRLSTEFGEIRKASKKPMANGKK